jgi:hypothetical protein
MQLPIMGIQRAAVRALETPAGATDAASTASKISGVSLLGYSAGAAGLVTTGLNLWKDSSSGAGFSPSSALGPSTVAMGGGATMLALAGDGLGARGTVLRGAGVALLVGGLFGAALGARERFSHHERTAAPASTQVQEPAKFGVELPGAPADLAGLQLGTGTVRTISDTGARSQRRVPIYIDPSHAAPMPADATLADAIAQARARSQGDPDNHAFGVLQARDGSRFIAPLTGDLDQVDGRFYSADNDFEESFSPTIAKQHPSLQAIAGVETRYTFPVGTGADEPPQDPGDIPRVTPTLTDGKAKP